MRPIRAGHDDAFGSLTDWLAGHVAPARPGVYRRRAPAGAYSCWNGTAWFGDAPTAAAAAREAAPSRFQAAPWRGQARPSEAPCTTCRGNGLLDAGDDDESGWPRVVPCTDC